MYKKINKYLHIDQDKKREIYITDIRNDRGNMLIDTKWIC